MARQKKPEFNKNWHPIPTLQSPPTLTPVILKALRILVELDKDVLAQLLLLGQDVDYSVLIEGGEYLHLRDFVSQPERPDYDILHSALEAINNRFLGERSWTEDGKGIKYDFMDVKWCQNYIDALFGMGFGYMIAVDQFVDAMRDSGRGESRLAYMPHWGEQHDLRTVKTLAVMRVVGALEEKPLWRNKIDAEEIVARWKDEALMQGLDETVIDTAIEDLKWLRKTHDPLTGSILTHVPRVYITDSLIEGEDLLALKEVIAALEDVPEPLKDWHPGSDGQVLDLVHPSLYPYVRGRTPRYVPKDDAHELNEGELSEIECMALTILGKYSLPVRHTYTSPLEALESICEGSPVSDKGPVKDTTEVLWPRVKPQGSKWKYQWLPTDVEIALPNSESDNIPRTFPTARFLSYINNLHPDSSTSTGKLYPVLERIFGKFIPLFERALRASSEKDRPKFPEPNDEGSDDDSETDGDGVESDDNDNNRGDGSEKASGRATTEYIVTEDASIDQTPNSADPPAEEEEDEDEEHRGEPPVFEFKSTDQLQVIVKLANIHLTPEKPDYPGGTWHVEGTDTERIVATGIYYYDSENINTSRLSFRVAVDDPDEYEYDQNRFGPLTRKYGIFQHGPANQDLGSVVTEQGRCIVFPNNMQHRVKPFSLADRTKPGHRKILAFFLINPGERVLSTSDVPPQQFEWYVSEIRKADSRLSRLPTEIFNLIMTHAAAQARREGHPWPMSWEEALKYRRLLMKERGIFARLANGEAYERKFSFCEH